MVKNKMRKIWLFPTIALMLMSCNSGHTLNGHLQLVDSDIRGSNSNCYGTGGYSDIRSSMAVTVKDEKGNIIGTSNTGSGYRPNNEYSGISCIFDFEVTNIPKSDFYSVEIGRRGQVNYSFSKLEDNDWEVSLILGP